MIRLFNRKKEKSEKKKLTGKEKGVVVLTIITILFAAMSLAAFRGIVYLSDGTFLIAKWPYVFIVIAIILIAVNAWIFKEKSTKKVRH